MIQSSMEAFKVLRIMDTRWIPEFVASLHFFHLRKSLKNSSMQKVRTPSIDSMIHIQFKLGSPVECMIESNNASAKTLILRVRPQKSVSYVTRGALQFSNLQCGMLVDLVVKRIVEVRRLE